jgi:polysaccharide deacetylase 2 family uncharacterized protein YibQ
MPRRRTVRRRRSNRSQPLWAVVAVSVVVAFGVGYYLGTRRPAEDTPAELAAPPPASRYGPAGEEARPAVPKKPAPPSRSQAPRALPRGEGARVALVIDDLGRRVEDVADFASLGVPVSFGVLPFESRTAQVVEALHRQGGEILVHLPMEPSNGADPGPGALTGTMGRRELLKATAWALDAIDGAAGVNNHMGSGLTANREVMETILGVLEERGLYFLDSRTSSETVAYRVARELGLPAAERQVFLDPESGPETVREQFTRLLELSRQRGAAIAIGHPHPSTLAVLREEVPRAVDAGYTFVAVSDLLDRFSEPS